MAAARKLEALNENFLTCSICTDRYKDPCTLTCGHTFCKVCLGKFLKTRQDAISAKSIPCPYCRQMTRVPYPDRQVEEWVRQIKPSFLIRGLLDTLAYGENTFLDTENCCLPCQDLGDRNPATSFCQHCDVQLCERCVKMHASLPATSNHVIADLGGAVKATRQQRPRCKEHNEDLDFCCRDCNVAICLRCCTAYHCQCHSVASVQSMMAEIRTVLSHKKEVFTQRFEDASRSLLQHRSQIEEISRNRDTAESQLKQVSQKVISVIKQKEKQLLDELVEMTEKQCGQLKGQMKSGEIDMQMYQQHIEYLSQVLKSGSETDMFEMYRMCQSGALNESTDRAGFSDSVGDSQVLFLCELDEGKLHNAVHLGRIQQNLGEPVVDVRLDRIQSSTFDVHSRPVFHQTVDIRVDGDVKKPDPADVTVLVVDGVETLVVTDFNNNCLKSFYANSYTSQPGKLALPCRPHTVTKLADRQVAVAFWSHNEIVIVDVTPYLFLQSRVTTKKKYRCLTALSPSTLAAGCVSPPCVDVLDVSGTVIRSVRKFNSGKNLIRDPRFLCTTGEGNILVSDTRSVYCITPHGDVVFTCTGARSLREPRGIATTSTGHILVADSGTRMVILLTATGEFVRDLLTSQFETGKPYGLFVCGHKLYVSQEDRCVIIFNSSTQSVLY
ncbi:E3 ubiquitin-protein ligase TRIM56-like [Haliotis rubra]|uniref:E3 ubiquitin-protein ligase TRIM56-like n=1 Tax=Haliotis rubra TaxID=36100 RepID=UPI001EE60055|nr:E3 ubiquitin-protein ligase TRIM56-like [Haliotis rubra]XP_046559814.1 E3 ubiquitin-protein ligase TRIM56-like [Haliotis rubra]